MSDDSAIDTIIAYVDGGSRGNPGPAASAWVLKTPDGNFLQSKAFFLGQATNNVAEYTAFNKALEAAVNLKAQKLTIFSDSKLLVKQINGDFKVKSEHIKPLISRAMELLKAFKDWNVQFIPREQNWQADNLVNKALNLSKNIDIESGSDSRSRNIEGPRISNNISPSKATGTESKIENPKSESKSTETGKNTVRLGVLISGGGRTMMNILEHINKGKLNAKITVVISSRSKAAGVQKAKNAGLDVKIIRKKDYPDIEEFSRQIEKQLLAADVDLVIQAGWLCLWKIPRRYENRVMNIHPALLPSFGGKGMWGHHVHEAVLERGCKLSGCTVHFCTNEYDKGPIIVQRCCEVKENDTPDSLAAKVFELECDAYPQAIKLFQQERITVYDNRVKIK